MESRTKISSDNTPILRLLPLIIFFGGSVLVVAIDGRGDLPVFKEILVIILTAIIYFSVSKNICDVFVDEKKVTLTNSSKEIFIELKEIKSITIMPMPLIRTMPLYHVIELFREKEGKIEFVFHSNNEEATADFLIGPWKLERATLAQESMKKRGARR